MPIDLIDIPAAVADYLDNHVTTTVSAVSSGGSIEDGEIGTFSVTVTNAAAPDGVRLIDVRYHVIVSPPSVAKLSANGSAIVRQHATNDQNSSPLGNGDLVEEYFIIAFTGVTELRELDPGETVTIDGLEVKGIKKGNATIKCHIHADIDQDSLFPQGENSPNGTHDFKVT
jgi:hypothetical protein